MTISVASFRAAYPEFSDGVRFPNSWITYYLALAGKLVANEQRWGDVLDFGQMLFIAHHLVLRRKAADAVGAGGLPGESSGIVNSEQVDKVRVGYDVAASIIDGAGHWNQTQYGIELFQMFSLFGAGSLQIGVDSCLPPNSGAAWAGPQTFNFPTPDG